MHRVYFVSLNEKIFHCHQVFKNISVLNEDTATKKISNVWMLVTSISHAICVPLGSVIATVSVTMKDTSKTLRWRHNGRDSVSNHQPHECFLNRLFRRRSKKTSKLRVTGLCAGNSLVTGEFSAQMASYAENVSIWLRHYDRRVINRRKLIETRSVCRWGNRWINVWLI